MIEESKSELFDIKINEEGKIAVQKFARISYVIITLVIIDSVLNLASSFGSLLIRNENASLNLYYKIYPYYVIVVSVMGLVSNIYYVRFPRQILKSIQLGDEYGANRSFRLLLKGAWIFLAYLILIIMMNVLSLTTLANL